VQVIASIKTAISALEGLEAEVNARKMITEAIAQRAEAQKDKTANTEDQKKALHRAEWRRLTSRQRFNQIFAKQVESAKR
jgi:hypothetical protein